MSDSRHRIFVVDDDRSVRDAVSNLLESVGFTVRVFSGTEQFLRAERPDVPSCLILDVRLPNTSGLDFQEQLTKAGISIPIIFITAYGDIPMTSRAFKAGAVEFLTKPFQKQDLLTAIQHALDRDRDQRATQTAISSVQNRLDHLSGREREVMDLVVTGLTNKEIALKLGLSEVTVKMYRGSMMKKMEATSLPELVRMAEKVKKPFSR